MARSTSFLVLLVLALAASTFAINMPNGFGALPYGAYTQIGDSEGSIVVSETGTSLNFFGLGGTGCAVAELVDPLLYSLTSGVLHASIPDLVIRNLYLNSLDLLEVAADAAVLDAVVDVLDDQVGLSITGTIAVHLRASVLPILHTIGLHGLLDGSIDLVLPIALESLVIDDITAPFVC